MSMPKVRRIGSRSEEARDFRFLDGVQIGGDFMNEIACMNDSDVLTK
jgi:hypothetical protein